MINCLICCGWYDILEGDSRYCNLVVDTILDPDPFPTQNEDHALLAYSTFRLPIETGAVVLAALVVVAFAVSDTAISPLFSRLLHPTIRTMDGFPVSRF